MADQEQLRLLIQGVNAWNKKRNELLFDIDLMEADLKGRDMSKIDLRGASLNLIDFSEANLSIANLGGADLTLADLTEVNLYKANINGANIFQTNFTGANLKECNFSTAIINSAMFIYTDLSECVGLENTQHNGPSVIGTETLANSKGKIPSVFLRGCGLSDWEVEAAKLYNPDLSNEEINQILYKMYEIRAQQPLQISPLFISYSHADSKFVAKLELLLNKRGIRFWRDIHSATAGRLETQIDRAIRQNPTVVLVLSANSLKSDWVQHEVRKARELEKEMGRDVLCPVALDESWKASSWPERVMEQVKEYNILDFSNWDDDSRLENMFKKLIDGLNLYYKK